MANLSELTPHGVWRQFDAITKVPRPSKKEAKIIAWLEDFAREHGLEHRRDTIGNVVISKPATRGMEDRPRVALQSHVDMVTEKNSDVVFDFEHDAIQTEITPDGWVKARGTTLGADNGLGMAMALALLVDEEAVHGPIEALFTVDEETGLTGAFNLGEGMITGQYLINLDSEDEGEVFIGCAGGVDSVAHFDFRHEAPPAGHTFFELSVAGLKGGHSGDDIEKGRGNSNKILARALWTAMSPAGSKKITGKGFDLRLATIDGGNLHNAIPREARAVVAVPEAVAADFERFVGSFAADIQGELLHSDPEVKALLAPHARAEKVIDAEVARRLVEALVGVPNGVQAMSFAMSGLVETSTNLASVKVKEGRIVVTTSQRSSVESAKKATAAAVESVFALAGARVTHSEGYPGWAPNPSSHLLEVTKEAYKHLFGKAIKVRAIHAGLECGLFLEKFPQLEMISTGPTILGVHSPDERIEIASVDKAWQLLLEVVKTLK